MSVSSLRHRPELQSNRTNHKHHSLLSFTANISDLLCPLFSCILVLHSSFNLHFFPLTFTFQISHFTTLPRFSLSPSRSVPSALLDLGYFPFVFISLSCSLWIRQWILTQTHSVCSAKSVGITTLNQARARGRRRKKSRYPPGFVQIQLMQNKELIWTWERPNVGLSGPYPHLTKMNGTIPTE